MCTELEFLAHVVFAAEEAADLCDKEFHSSLIGAVQTQPGLESELMMHMKQIGLRTT